MKWQNLQTPEPIELDETTASDRYGKFTLAPLERGFGLTVGNALRRVLLSGLQGAAVTAAKVEGALHEFSTIPGVLEDVSEVILNLKQIRFKLHADFKINARFKKAGAGEVVAGDLQADSGVEILNPDLHIATLNKDGDFDMEVEISGGRGYVAADQQGEDRPIGVIPVDAHFSPIRKVNFQVENTRVGQRVDFDKLTLEVWTDGSILPKDAIAYAASILQQHFMQLVDFEKEPIIPEPREEEDQEVVRIRDLLDKSVEELELSVRSANCLRAAGIKSIGELVTKNESAMLKYRNFGRKSLKEISDILDEMGLKFGMDITPYQKRAPRRTSDLEAGPVVVPPPVGQTALAGDEDDTEIGAEMDDVGGDDGGEKETLKSVFDSANEPAESEATASSKEDD